MTNLAYLKPAFVCISALALTACSGNNFTLRSNTAASHSKNTAQINLLQPNSELYRIAAGLAAEGNHSAAIPLLRHLSESGYDPVVLTTLAQSLLAQGAGNEANIILSGLIELGFGSGPVFYAYGKTLLVQGQFNEALLAFQTAAPLMVGDARAASGQAISLAALGRTDEALASFKTRSDVLTLSNKALIFAATGSPAAAVRILEALMRSGKATSRDRQNLAMAYLLAGRETEAARIARIDLDVASIGETFTFYRSLVSLPPARRMQALVTGTVNPEWTRSKYANLDISESAERQVAAKRIVNEPLFAKRKPTLLAQVVAPKVKPEPKPQVHAQAILTDIPPLLEPEGWALQIGAYRTLKNLKRGWTILYRKSGDLLKDVPARRSEVVLKKKDGGPDGFYYRLNAGPLNSFAEAKTLCTALQARGTKCWIRPPETSEGSLPTLDPTENDNAAPVITAALRLP